MVHVRHLFRPASFCLLFRIAAMVALRYNLGEDVGVCSQPWAFDRLLEQHDPKHGKKEYPGAFHFSYRERVVVVSGDGRVLLSPEPSISLWERYISGESQVSLARWVLDQLGVARMWETLRL